MSIDALRDLQKIGKHVNGVDPNELGVKNAPNRSCLIVSTPRDKLDSSAYFDGLKAARMFQRADFKVFFLSSPEYCDYYQWLRYFLTNSNEYFALVITGFPMATPTGETNTAVPFTIADREIPPTKLFKHIKKFKNQASRVTVLISGCPAIETWSNGDPNNENIAFSKTSINFQRPNIRQFQHDLPERVLLASAAIRLDVHVDDRAKGGEAHFFDELSQIVKDDPVLSAAEVLMKLAPKIRKYGEEPFMFSSSYDIENDRPFLL